MILDRYSFFSRKYTGVWLSRNQSKINSSGANLSKVKTITIWNWRNHPVALRANFWIFLGSWIQTYFTIINYDKSSWMPRENAKSTKYYETSSGNKSDTRKLKRKFRKLFWSSTRNDIGVKNATSTHVNVLSITSMIFERMTKRYMGLIFLKENTYHYKILQSA